MRRIITIVALSLSAMVASYAQTPKKLGGEVVENVSVVRKLDSISVKLDLNIKSLRIPSGSSLTFIPTLGLDRDSLALPAIEILGNKRYIYLQRNKELSSTDNIYRTIVQMKGIDDVVKYDVTVPYQSWMDSSFLYINKEYCKCDKQFYGAKHSKVKDIHLAPIDFVPYFSFVVPEVEAKKTRYESGSAFIDFPVNMVDIRPDYRNNTVEINKIHKTIESIKDDPDVKINSVTIKGFASPEGPYDNNARLAKERTQALADYLNSKYQFPQGFFTVSSEPEDWAGFRRMVEESNLPHKTELLKLIDRTDMEADPKEYKIRVSYPEDYAIIKEKIYPALRHSDYTVEYTVRGFNVDEARDMFSKHPERLSLNEMFLLAKSYPKGSDEFNNILETAARIFPDDETANLNAAFVAISKGEPDKAEVLLMKAGDSPSAKLAKGFCKYMKGDSDAAESLIKEAENLGIEEASKNLRIYFRK